MENIETLEQVAEVLQDLGYEIEVDENTAVYIKVGGNESPFTAVVTCDTQRERMDITCQVAKLGDIPDEATPKFMLAALDANTAMRPYAFAVISDTDNPEYDEPEEWPVVLTESIPLGDLCREEIEAAMDSLWMALAASRPVIEVGFGK